MSQTTQQREAGSGRRVAGQADERRRLLRILHAEAAKRGVTHETLSIGAQEHWGVSSMADLTAAQLREFVQRVCVKLDHRRVPARPSGRTTARPRVSRPSGRRRPEGVVWLPTARQRRFIADLLGQYCADDRDPVAVAVRYVRARIGADLPADVGLPDLEAIASQIQTGKAAGVLINCLIGDLKRAGRWGSRSAPCSRNQNPD